MKNMKSKNIKNYIKQNKMQLLFRAVLSLFVIFTFLLVFFLCDGISYFKYRDIVTECSNNELEVHYIDVGQGDATLIKFPNEKTMLIDTGEDSESDKLINYISKFLNLHSINSLDYLVLTHPDSDHVGGTKTLTENFNIGLVFRPKCLSVSESMIDSDSSFNVFDTASYEEAISSLYDNQIEMKYSQSVISFYEGNVLIEFLSPTKDNYSNSNNYSAVIKMSYNDKSFLFTGDAEIEVENELVDLYGSELDVDVLKVSHHGSKSASSENFINLVSPTFACVSVGVDNQYNLPNQDVLDRLNNVGSEIITTSQNGSFAISVNQNILQIHYLTNYAVDFSILIVVFGVIIVVIWGIKLPKSKKK